MEHNDNIRKWSTLLSSNHTTLHPLQSRDQRGEAETGRRPPDPLKAARRQSRDNCVFLGEIDTTAKGGNLLVKQSRLQAVGHARGVGCIGLSRHEGQFQAAGRDNPYPIY